MQKNYNSNFIYLRYLIQFLPTAVGVGTPVASDANMIDLFLQWNADDPVSQFEDNRNTYLGNASNTYGQGNRNPFIDNPYLATVIWGGPIAQNRWPSIFLDAPSFDLASAIAIYPNPSSDYLKLNNLKDKEDFSIMNNLGQQVKNGTISANENIDIQSLSSGIYYLKLKKGKVFKFVKK